MPCAGVLHIDGRCSLQAKVGGVRVDLLEVERLLCRHPLVREAAVAAWPHPARPQDSQVAAYVVLRQQRHASRHTPAHGDHGSTVSADLQQQLRSWLAQQLPGAAVPAVFVGMAALPRAAAGKVLRSQLPRAGSMQQQQRERQAAEQPLPRQQQVPAVAQTHAGGGACSEAAVMRAMLAALAPPPPTPAPAAAAAAPAAAPAAATSQPPAVLLEPTEDFFVVGGGDSLAAAVAAASLGIDTRLLFAYPTARALAAFLRSSAAAPGGNHSSSFHIAGSTGAANDADSQQQQQQQEQQPVAAKRRRLVSPPPSRAPNSTAAPLQPPVAVAALLAAASTAVVVSAGSHTTTWQLQEVPSSGAPAQCAAAAAAAAAAATAGDRSMAAPAAGTVQAAPDIEQQQGQLDAARGSGLSLHWRLPLGRCVDAAPLLLVLLRPAAVASSCQQRLQQLQLQQPLELACSGLELVRALCFACSHDGSVACVDVESGARLWGVALPARADAGMSLSRCCSRLAVAAGDAHLYCLRTGDGSELAVLPTPGGVRTAPATDPWWGLWWLVTHGRQLMVVAPQEPLQVVARCVWMRACVCA
jgi:hypothetical protein